jgi:hypothetical protein
MGRFNGIPINEPKPSGGRFGGIPIDEQKPVGGRFGGIPVTENSSEDAPDIFAPGNEKLLEEARAKNRAALPGQLYGLAYGAAKSVVGGAGEVENLVRKTVPEYFGAKPLYEVDTLGNKSGTFLPTMEQVTGAATSMGIPAPANKSAETVGEFIPAVKAGVSGIQALAGALRNAKQARAAIPSVEKINDATTALYTAAKNEGVAIKPQAWNKFSQDLGRYMTSKEAMLTTGNSPAIKALDTIQAETATNMPITLEKADRIRQSVNGYIQEALASGNNNEARLAIVMKDKLDDFLNNLDSNPKNYTGNASKAIPILREARASSQKGFKADTIRKFKELAEAQKGAKYNPVLVEKKLRDQFVKLEQDFIEHPSLAKSWTAEERAAIQKVVQGGPVQEAMRQLSKPFPIIGVPGSVIPILGSTAKRVSASVGQKNVKLLDELVRQGGPVVKTQLKPTARQAALAAALSLNRAQEEPRPNYEDFTQ